MVYSVAWNDCIQTATSSVSDEEETDLESLKAGAAGKDYHDNSNDDEEWEDGNKEEHVDDETEPAPRKRSLHEIRATIGSRGKNRPRQRQRQRLASARTSSRPTTGAGRWRPTSAGRRKGGRYRGRMNPAGNRPTPGQAAPLADDAAAVDDSASGPEVVERKSCRQVTCVKGRGTCVDENSGPRCRCQLGAAGNLCERGT